MSNRTTHMLPTPVTQVTQMVTGTLLNNTQPHTDKPSLQIEMKSEAWVPQSTMGGDCHTIILIMVKISDH